MILASYRVVGLEPLAHRVFEALLSQHLQRIVMCIKLPYRNTLLETIKSPYKYYGFECVFIW